MKKIFLTLLLLIVMSVSVVGQAAPYWSCDGWGCLGDGHKDWFVTGRSDVSNWDLAIWNGDPEQVEDQAEFQWINHCEDQVDVADAFKEQVVISGTPFSVNYDPDTGIVTYIVDGETLTFDYGTDKAYEYLVLMSKGNDGGDMALFGLDLDGLGLPDVVSDGNYEGLVVPMSDAMQQDGFTLTGYGSMCWFEKTSQEIPGFHVFAMNTHDLPDDEIPEFGIIGAVAVLGLAGLFIARKRN